MGVALIRHMEPLNVDERAFLKRQEARERRQLYKAVRIMLPFCFILPFAAAWGEAIVGRENPFSQLRYFSGVAIFGAFLFTGAFIVYRRNVYKLGRDLAKGLKTVEQVRITGKRFMPHDNSCHLYLESQIRLSIEVSAEDFTLLRIGDFVNLEYSPRAKTYLGYS
jgi:hypothetical protein